MPNNDTTTKFKVDISELKSAMQEAKRQVSIANSEFKAVSSSMDDWTKSSDGLSAKLKQLDSNLKNQKTILSNLERQYELTVQEMGEGSKAADDLKVKINNQKAVINNTEKQIKNYESALDEVSEAEKTAAKTGKTVAEVLEDMEQEAKDAGDGFTVMKGVLANLATAGINLVVDAFKNLCSTIKESYEAYDEGADIIIQKTGAVGEAATSLQDSYKKVSKSVVGEFADIGTAIGEVNTRFGITGSDLEDLTTKFLKFSELNGTDVNSSIDSVQKTLAAFGLEADDAGSVLDTMNKVGQDTGVSMDVLSNLLMENASSFSQMGLDVHQAAGFLGDIEKSGVSTSVAMTSLSKASQYAAEENKPLTEVLKETNEKMKNAKTDAEGLQVAYDVFGKKAGAKIYEACKTGSLSFDDLSKAMQNNSGSIDETYEATQDGMDKIKLAVQGAKADVGDAVASFLDEHKDDIVEAIDTVTTGIKDFFNFIKDNGDTIIAVLSGIAAGFIAFNVASMIMGVVNAFKAFKLANEGATVAQWLLNAAMNANPIMLIVTLLVAVVAGIVAFIATNENARKKFKEIWENITKAFNKTVDGIVNFFKVTIPKVFSTAIAWVKTNFAALLLFLINPFAGLFKYFYDNNTKFKEFVDNAVKYIKQLPSKVWTWLLNTINKVSTWASDMKAKAISAASGFINSAISYIKQLPSKVWSWLSNVVSKVVSWGTNLASKGKQAAKQLYDSVVNKVKEIVGKVQSIGKDIVNGLWNGIKSKISNLYDNIKNAMSGLVDKAKKALGINSPSKVFAEAVGKWIPEGIAVGIDKNAKSALSSMRNLAVDTVGAAKNGLSSVATTVGGTGVGGVTNNFYQTINSPKQLSRLDIYRQSKNLLGYAGGGY